MARNAATPGGTGKPASKKIDVPGCQHASAAAAEVVSVTHNHPTIHICDQKDSSAAQPICTNNLRFSSTAQPTRTRGLKHLSAARPIRTRDPRSSSTAEPISVCSPLCRASGVALAGAHRSVC
eukprot:366523-Chlamydomonas_euryale.AAC.1